MERKDESKLNAEDAEGTEGDCLELRSKTQL